MLSGDRNLFDMEFIRKSDKYTLIPSTFEDKYIYKNLNISH
jgi:hypothetical protein